MARDVVVRPAGTSWGAVLDGWLAAVGVAALLTPLVGVLLASVYAGSHGYAATIPVLCAVGLAYLIGGYVAGRMAGYRTSWHGMMVAFFGVFVMLALVVIDLALGAGVFGTSGKLVPFLPSVLGLTQFDAPETFAFGGALSILSAIFTAWLGGLLAPSRITTAVTSSPAPVGAPVEERRVTTTEVHRPRERFRLLPGAGRKGGERVTEADEVERTRRIEPS